MSKADVERGNYLVLYYKNAKISFWTGDLSNEEAPTLDVTQYSETCPKPDRALPYNFGTLRKSLQTYGPAVRYPIVHLEMIRMHKRSIDTNEPNVPPMEGMAEFVATSYPSEVQDAMKAAISCVQSIEVTRASFVDKVEPLAMTIAVIFQEPKLCDAINSDSQTVEEVEELTKIDKIDKIDDEQSSDETVVGEVVEDMVMQLQSPEEAFEHVSATKVEKERPSYVDSDVVERVSRMTV